MTHVVKTTVKEFKAPYVGKKNASKSHKVVK
jgi:hypothetical protein